MCVSMLSTMIMGVVVRTVMRVCMFVVVVPIARVGVRMSRALGGVEAVAADASHVVDEAGAHAKVLLWVRGVDLRDRCKCERVVRTKKPRMPRSSSV
jgi:hypothetical protein